MLRERRFCQSVEKLAINIVRFIGATIFGVLTVVALISSQYMLPFGEELPVNKMDFPLFQILAVLAVAVLVFVVRKYEKSLKHGERYEKVFLAVSMLFVFICGILWIRSLDRVPEGDQAFLYAGASYFIEGDFSFFKKGAYCQIYPQQIDLMAFTELLFRMVGKYNYFAFEILNVFMATGIVGIGYLLLKEMGGTYEARILYCMGMLCCSPLICYTSWVYGDVPGLFFLMLTALFVLKWQSTRKWPIGIWTVISGVLALLLRRNNLIFLIALLLLSIVCVIDQRKWKTLLIVGIIYCGFVLCSSGIKEMYEIRSGYEVEKGLPANSWIAMGMQENKGVCGWYNNIPKEVAAREGWDYVKTEQEMTGIIKERLGTFLSDPVYGVGFYVKKVLSQWNDPTYQGVYFSAKYNSDDRPEEGSTLANLYDAENGYFIYFEWANISQFVVYLGMLFYFCLKKFEGDKAFSWILAVTIIGGFFFSILWEAKARYIFPYYVMMIPLMAQGYSLLIDRIMKRIEK